MTLEQCKQERDLFLSHITVERNLSTHTQKAYKNDLNQFIIFWENLSSSEPALNYIRTIIERYLVSLFYKKIDKSSIARKFSAFKSFERFLYSRGIELKLNLQRPRLDKKLPLCLSEEEISFLLDTVGNHDLPTPYPIRDKAIFETLYATGIRCSELVNIALKDLDMTQKTIRILGKGKKERIVLFGKKAQDKITQYLHQERKEAYNDDEKLFLNHRDQKLTSRSIQRIFEMFRSFLKINRQITPHTIRHSFATHMLNRGADLRVVQELLGHSILSSTEIYTHISLEKLTELSNTIHPIKKYKF